MTDQTSTQPDYWLNRADAIYLQYMYAMARTIGRDAISLLDVGSKNCAYLEWFDWIPKKVSIDLVKPYASATVEGITGDFLTSPLPGPFDICLCLQVMEHIPDDLIKPFAARLMEMSPQLIVSVPYKWKAGWVDFHPQDPVDEAKMLSWFGREPNYSYIIKEPFARSRRIVCWYDREDPTRTVEKEEFRRRLSPSYLR